MRKPASPSLFWTFAGAFLIVLIAGLAVQAIVLFSLVGPIATARLRSDAESIAQRAASEVGRELETGRAPDPQKVLDGFAAEGWRHPLVFIDTSGKLYAHPTAGGPWRQRLNSDLVHRGLLEPPAARAHPDSMPHRGEFAESSDGNSRRLFLKPRGAGLPAQTGFGEDGERTARRNRIVVRTDVFAGDSLRGEIVAFVTPRRPFGLPPGIPSPALFFLPVAALIAGIAGLCLFRALAHRLRALEGQARRVARGDLTARLPDLGKDEIGKLGVSLNEMTERLAESRQRLDEAEQQRRRFLADVTHELSTPLTTVRGYTETLLNRDVPVSKEERDLYLGHVLEESHRMDALLRDLLDLARLESGAADTVRERIDLVALLRHAIQRHAARFSQAGVALHWKPESIDSAEIEAEGRRMEQVVDNLLGNELRYVPRNRSVWVGADLPSLDPTIGGTLSDSRLRLTVEDDGPGFPPESLGSVFDRFYRADPSRSSEGTGLGLAIVKEIVLRHGGTVRAMQRAGGGARVEVLLPRAK